MKTTTASLGTAIIAIFVMAVATGQEAEENLTNSDIVTLVEAGLTSSAIIALIESRGTEFNTSVAQPAALSRAGVDSAVVEAMIRASASEGSPSVSPQAGAAAASAAGRRAPTVAQPGATSVPSRQPGETFSDALNSGGRGPEMVVIPAGRLQMGCVSGQECDDDEFPVHDVTIRQAFAVSKYEVTFEEYDRYTYPNRVDDWGVGAGVGAR